MLGGFSMPLISIANLVAEFKCSIYDGCILFLCVVSMWFD